MDDRLAFDDARHAFRLLAIIGIVAGVLLLIGGMAYYIKGGIEFAKAWDLAAPELYRATESLGQSLNELANLIDGLEAIQLVHTGALVFTPIAVAEAVQHPFCFFTGDLSISQRLALAIWNYLLDDRQYPSRLSLPVTSKKRS